MSTNIDISFIVPVFDKKIEDVEECLQSLQTSNFNTEILFINDGSNSSLSLQYRKVASKYNAIYIYKNNGGVSSARNLGIKKAKGKYVSFVDADDKFFIENLHPSDWQKDADIILYDVEKTIGKSKNKEISKMNLSSGNVKLQDILKESFRVELIDWSVAKLYSLRFLKDHHLLFKEQMKYSEDFDFVFRILNENPIIKYYSRIVYLYKFSTASGTEREKKYPLVVLDDLNRNYDIQSEILRKVFFAKNQKNKIDKKIRQKIIKDDIRIYSNYLGANYNEAKKNIDPFIKIINKVEPGFKYDLTTRVRINMIKGKKIGLIYLYYYAKKIYHVLKGDPLDN